MRQAKEKSQKENTDPPTEAEMEEDRVRSKAATLAHDAKVRAFVEKIKKDNAKKWPDGRPEAEGATGASETVPIAYDAGAMAGGTLAEVKAAEDERDEAETFTVNQPATTEAAAKATDWLASQGISAPPAKSDGGVDSAAVDAATADAAADNIQTMRKNFYAAVDAAVDTAAGAAVDTAAGATADAAAGAAAVQPASSSAIEDVLDYRVYLGSEQWQVRWAGEGGTSWEKLCVLDTESLQDRAAQLRAASTGGS